MSRPDVLVYIDWFSPGFRAGGPIRSMLNLAEQLAPFVRFNIITRDRDYLSDSAYPDIQTNTWLDFGEKHRIHYVSPERCDFKGLKSAGHEVSYSKVYINGFLSPRFSILPLFIHRDERDKVILAPRGMLRSSATSLKPLKKSLFYIFSKLFDLHKGIRFHATDEQELEDIKLRFPRAHVRMSPNLSRPMTEFCQSRKELGSLKIVFIGRVAPEKNLLFALKALNKVTEGKIYFQSYGAVYDQGYWKSCQDLSSKLPENVKHTHSDNLHPEEVIHILQGHDLLFLPTLGENFGHVILESFMASRPVLISDQTPWRNLEIKSAGTELSLNDPKAFREYLAALLMMSEEEHQKLCEGAYKVAKSFCEDERLLTEAKALFLDR